MAAIRKSSFRTLGCLLVIFFLISISHAYAIDLSSQETEYLRTKGTIVFVSQTRYPPFEFTDAGRQHEGMMLDVVHWMAVEMGFKPAFIDMPFQQAQEAVVSGRADILTSLFYSEKRKERFEFTQTLFDVPASIFVRAERTDINDIKGLNGKTIAIQRGDYAKDFLESHEISFDTLDTEDFAQATDMVIAGRADAVIGDEQIVLYHIFSNRLTDYVKKMGEPLYIGKNCMASNKDNAILIGILNKGIHEAGKSGVLDKISRKWLGTKYGPPESFLERYLWALSAVAGTILLLSLGVWVWNVRLRTLVRKKTEVIAQREEALRESEERFRNLMEFIPGVSIQGYRADGTVVYWNKASETVYGYTAEEALGRNLEDLIIPEDLKPLFRECLELAKGIKKCGEFMPPGELLLLHRDGRLVPVYSIHTCVCVEGKESTFFCIDFDLSERKRIEETLRESEHRYRTLVENASDIVLKTDETGHFTFVNPVTLRITGYKEEEIIGKPYSFLIREDMREEAIKFLRHQFANRIQNTYYTFPIITKEGREVWLAQHASLILEDDRATGLQAVARDVTEGKRAEEALRQSEEKYRLLFESLIDVYYQVDSEGRIIMVSPSITRAAGYQPEEVIGADVRDFYVRPEERDRMLELLMRSGIVEDFEVEMKAKDGSVLWVSFNARMKMDNEGNFLGIEGIARDITYRRQSEDALRQEYSFRNTVIDDISEGLCVCHETADYPFLQFTIWNNRMTEITGWTVEEVNRLDWYQTVFPDPELQARAVERMERVREGENIGAEQWVITRADGNKRVLNVSNSVVESDDGLVHILALMQDITEHKHNQEVLRESETRYRLLAENATDVIWTVGMDMRLTYISPSVTRLLGFTVEEAMARTMQQAYTPTAFEKAMEILSEEMAIESAGRGGPARSRIIELELVRKDGNTVPVEGNFCFLRDPKGEAIAILAIVRDITERKLAEEALKASLQEKEVLLREIHHRVKNNMQVISSLLTIQAERMENDQLRQALLESQQRIVAMAMIHEVLYSGRNLAAIELSSYLKSLVQHLRGVYNSEGDVRIVMELDKVELGIDQAVPSGLIINELITNSFKHAFPGESEGEIQIKVYLVDSKEVVLEVRDNGVGLSADLDLGNPSSLGLRLVQGLLQHQLKGRLDVAIEGGTVFTLRWPLPAEKGGSE